MGRLSRLFALQINKTEEKDATILRLGILIASAVFLLCHALFLFYYRAVGVSAMVNVNIVSVLCYAVALLANTRRPRASFGLIVVVELAVYCLLTVYYIGWAAGAQWHLTVMILPFYCIHQIPVNVRRICVGIFLAALAGCYVITLTTTPVYSGISLLFMTTLNLGMTIAGPVLIAAVLNFSNKITESLYNRRIDALTEEANRDALTGLWNRRYAEQAVEELFSSAAAKAGVFIAMADIDLFKNINDTLGHAAGDEVLIWLSSKMQQHFRTGDVVARWGGEEFLIILPETDARGAAKALDAFMHRLRESVVSVAGQDVRVTVSIGYESCAVCASYAECIRHCDEAMYYGKRSGRNKLVYYADLPRQ